MALDCFRDSFCYISDIGVLASLVLFIELLILRGLLNRNNVVYRASWFELRVLRIEDKLLLDISLAFVLDLVKYRFKKL